MLSSLFADPASFVLRVLYFIPGALLAFTVHEFMHAAAAVALGDPTPRNQGRLTLNPGVHIDWVGFILLLLFGYGWARPVMVSPSNFRHPRRDDLLVSAAGPVSNLLMAVALFPLMRVVTHPNIAPFFASAYMINVSLFFLNMLPVPPLDGFHILKSLLPFRALKTLWTVEQYGFLILVLLAFTGILGTVLSVGTGLVTGALLQVFG